METNSREFGLFIDGLRLDRNMSREDLCQDIISLSQYKRYLRGASSIPNDKLGELADRLRFSISEIHLMFRHRSDNQFKEISFIYRLIKQQKFQEAYDIALKLTNQVVVSTYNEMFLDFCLINIQHNLNLVSDIHVLDLYSRLIDYPACAKNDSFNWVEVSVLINIVLTSAKMNNYDPSKVMYRIITSRDFKFISSGNYSYIPAIFSTLAQVLGRQDEYDMVLDVTQKGIDFCHHNETFTALSLLYLLNSFSNYDLGNLEEAKLGAKKAFMQLYIEDKPDKLEQFKVIFEKKFEMELDDLVKL